MTVLRGWLCERTMLYPDGEDDMQSDPAAIWDHRVFDAATIYPFSGGDRVTRVTHQYLSSIGDLEAEPMYKEWAKKLIDDGMSEQTSVTVTATYWQDMADGGRKPSWWHAVTGTASSDKTGEWIKEPTEIGYNPWTIALAKGAAYRQTPWDEQGYLEEMGTGILEEAGPNFKYLSRMATKLNELLSLESNPPVTVYMANNQPKKIEFTPGSRNFLLAREKLEAHRIGPNAGDYKLLWDIVQQRADRATLPGAFFSEFGGESGFSAVTLMAAGKDILYPFVECVNIVDAMKYRKALEIYRDHGPSKKLRVKMLPDGMGRVLSAELSAKDIEEQGVYVEITREDMTPQELATRVNLALAMVRDKVISLKTARKDWIKIRNPDAENLQVLAELVYLNEEVTKALTGTALSATGSEHLKKVWELVQNPLPAMAGTPPVGALPAGMPPQPPGLPTQTLPPIAGGNLLTNTQASLGTPGAAGLNPILALLQGGGVTGGAGAGGLPPVPGTGSPVPLLPPPGRGI
jgi:hypothetical protein